jgi:hypothetical protein
MMTLAQPLTPSLSPRRGRSFFSGGKEPMRSDFSQRGLVTFPLLGERVRVSHTVNCIVPAKTISGVPASA